VKLEQQNRKPPAVVRRFPTGRKQKLLAAFLRDRCRLAKKEFAKWLS